MKVFPKRYHPPGTSPGTLAPLISTVPLAIRLTDYSDSDYVEKEIGDPAECVPFLVRDSTTWVQVQGGVPPATLTEFGQLFGLHPLALEDVVNVGQRAKLEAYDEQVFIAGVYGMNFGDNTRSWWAMPELRWDYGYPAVWLLMIVIAGVMLYLFKRNKWM